MTEDLCRMPRAAGTTSVAFCRRRFFYLWPERRHLHAGPWGPPCCEPQLRTGNAPCRRARGSRGGIRLVVVGGGRGCSRGALGERAGRWGMFSGRPGNSWLHFVTGFCAVVLRGGSQAGTGRGRGGPCGSGLRNFSFSRLLCTQNPERGKSDIRRPCLRLVQEPLFAGGGEKSHGSS